MQTSMLLGMFDWIGDFFKALFDLIPKVMYLLYASAACVLDVLQLFFRKLAGLDVYYVDGEPVTGDLVTNFITGILGINSEGFTYSALTTVFWSMVVFGVIMCFACTIVAIIKSHYSYNEKSAKGPMQYVYTAGKAIINMVAVPIIVVLGLFVSEAILTALDTITSTSSGDIVSMYGQQNVTDYLVGAKTSADASLGGNSNAVTYINYDVFGFAGAVQYGPSKTEPITGITYKDIAKVGSKNQTFSGSLFKVAAYNANRVRIGEYKTTSKVTGFKNSYGGSNGKKMLLFQKAGDDPDKLADMIDTAFACRLQLNDWYWFDYPDDDVAGNIVSMKYFTNFLTLGTTAFSKFNVGAVWYYYDLWQFNFIVGFAGVIVCVSIFINIILGLMTRLFMCIGLFLVAPPLFGLAPLDEGKAAKSWRENFMKQVLMAYGAVLGMNIMFLILPYINQISFFNIGIADYFAQVLVIIVGLITIKAFISTFSGLVGGADANETGGKISEEVGSVVGKATNMTIGAAKLGTKAWSATVGQIPGLKQASKGVSSVAKGAKNALGRSWLGQKLGMKGKAQQDLENAKKQDDMMSSLEGLRAGDFNEKTFRKQAQKAGFSKRQTDEMVQAAQDTFNNLADGEVANVDNLRDNLASRSTNYSANRRDATDNNIYAARIKNFEAVRNGRLLKRAGASIKGGIGSVMSTSYDLFKGDKFISTFMHDSKFKEKPGWAKQTAANTGAILDSIAGKVGADGNRSGGLSGAVRDGFTQAHADAALNNTLQELNTKRERLEENVRQAQRRLDKARAAGASAKVLGGYKAQITRMDNELRDILNEIKRQGY